MHLVILYEVFYPKKDAWVREKTVANTLGAFTTAMEFKEREYKLVDAWPESDRELELTYWDKEYKPLE